MTNNRRPDSVDWVQGDFHSLEIPAHLEALLVGGADFLNRAMAVAGSLERGNTVTGIVSYALCLAGSTGQKAILELKYLRPLKNKKMVSQVFVKFSRDFADPMRDAAKFQLEAEVKLGLLSHNPDFPIAVPRCYFADYHLASGTGLIISECLPFGKAGIEPLYEKCLDYELPEPLEHYQTIMQALGRLAGAHKAGRLPSIEKLFPYSAEQQSFTLPIRYSEQQLTRRLEKLTNFVDQYPQLLPARLVNPSFVAALNKSLPNILQQEQTLKTQLCINADYIALMHWNANIDNAWFWRDKTGELCCGLMDWGGVSQMNIGLALWGSLSAVESDFLELHLDGLLNHFIDAFYTSGGAKLALKTLKQHVIYSALVMGLSWLMDAPALIIRDIPDLHLVDNRFDAKFSAKEAARTQLQMLCNFLHLWQLYIIESAKK
jgi:hypothetical protein